MTIEVQHVLYADNVKDAAAIMDNVIKAGVNEIRATLERDTNVWRVEYKTEAENESISCL